MMACGYVPGPDRFASGMLSFLDCQAATLGSRGYGALAAPGSSVSLLLLTLLTVFVALFGYRLLFGAAPTVREGVLAFVKVGVVLALATNWPAYQTLIYDVALRAPNELAAEIGGASELPGVNGDLSARLDGADQAFRTLSIYGVGVPFSVPGLQDQQVEPSPWAGFDTFALGTSRIVFLGTAVGGFALVRLAAGLLLAVGPLFIAFLLFAGTRGLFEGWLRALVGTAVGALVASLVLGVELSLLEPWLSDLVARRAAGEAVNGVPATLLATTLIFAGVLAGLIMVARRLAAGLRLPDASMSIAASAPRARSETAAALVPDVSAMHNPSREDRSRAVVVADAVAAAQRREEHRPGSVSISTAAASGSTGTLAGGGRVAGFAQEPIGQRFRRRTATRISASSRLRDRRA